MHFTDRAGDATADRVMAGKRGWKRGRPKLAAVHPLEPNPLALNPLDYELILHRLLLVDGRHLPLGKLRQTLSECLRPRQIAGCLSALGHTVLGRLAADVTFVGKPTGQSLGYVPAACLSWAAAITLRILK
jgi:hypothetical protein